MAARGEEPPRGRHPLDPQVVRAMLGNGLRVATVRLPHLHTATIALYVRAGPRYEAPAESGLSHLVEHMLFRGTGRFRTSRALSTAVEDLGAALHAETGRDLTVLELSLPPDRLDAGLGLLGEVVTRPRFGGLEAERTLVLEEMSEDHDEEGRETNAEDLAFSLQLPGHPLGQRILGPRENVESFTAADVRRHFYRVYCARNAVLCVAGPVEPRAVVASAGRHLSSLPPGSPAVSAPASPPRGGPRLTRAGAAGPLCSLALTLAGVPEQDPGHAAFEALFRVLDGGMSGRLYQGLCVHDGLAYTVDADLLVHADTAHLQFTAEVAPAKAGRVVEGVLGLLSALSRRPVPEGELRRVRAGYRSALLAQLDDSRAMAEWFGAAALFHPPPLPSQRLARLARLAPRDVMRAARRVARPEGLSLAVVGPLGRGRWRAVREAVARWR